MVVILLSLIKSLLSALKASIGGIGMFIFFAENRANYKKGQIFPFLIAILVVIIIMAMITANLGKIAIFKTDVSNAADAGSLGAASVLSGFLLGLGLESDAWCANAIVLIARMSEIFILGRDTLHITLPGISLSHLLGYGGNDTARGNLRRYPNDLIAATKLYIPYLIGFQFALIKANMNGVITWSSAKQKALADAFGNAGVDEGLNPSKKYKNFYPLPYDWYSNQYMARERNQTGFSRFMSHPVTGYGWMIGRIVPGIPSLPIVTSGYGWSQKDYESFENSFDKGPGWLFLYLLEDNYVQVVVTGRSSYPIKKLTWTENGMVAAIGAGIVFIGAYLKYVRAGQCHGWWGKIKCLGYAATVAGFYAEVMLDLPVGYTFSGRNMAQYTTNAPITVRVKRYKKDTDMSMWNFQYGGLRGIVANSAGHAFVDHEVDSTIEPTLYNFMQGAWGNPSSWFNARRHLFETELTGFIN